MSSLGGGGGHDHDDDEDDEDEDDSADRRGPRDLFAGGEKSGLAVQDPARNAADPQNVIKDILAKAKAYVQRPVFSSYLRAFDKQTWTLTVRKQKREART